MIYELKTPIQVMDSEMGSYVDATQVTVKFTGRKGLKAIKGLQDVIFSSIQSASKNNPAAAEKDEDEQDTVFTADKLVKMLSMTGKSEFILDAILKTLLLFASVGNQKMNNTLLDEIDIDDMDNLCEEVMRNFLLPKIIQMMSSMKK